MNSQKTKTLVIILNHNLPEYTNLLYHNLKPYEKEIYDRVVMDNGSLPYLMPEFSQVKIKKNLYWGGALNVAFKMVLENPVYDSLLFLNNDIELTPEIFVEALRNELFTHDFAIVSPCVAGSAQPWKQMQNWAGKQIREVKWIDNQAPLFHRKIIEAIVQFRPELYYGWGQELICFDVCQEKAWKIGVCDHISIVHIGKQTLQQERLFKKNNSGTGLEPISLTESHQEADHGYRSYFKKYPLKHGEFDALRSFGETYTFTNPVDKKEENQKTCQVCGRENLLRKIKLLLKKTIRQVSISI